MLMAHSVKNGEGSFRTQRKKLVCNDGMLSGADTYCTLRDSFQGVKGRASNIC